VSCRVDAVTFSGRQAQAAKLDATIAASLKELGHGE